MFSGRTPPGPELIREAEAYFDGASPLVAVFLAEAPSGEPMGMLELSLRLVAEGCRTTSVPYVEGWYIAVRRVGAESGASSWQRPRHGAVRRGTRNSRPML